MASLHRRAPALDGVRSVVGRTQKAMPYVEDNMNDGSWRRNIIEGIAIRGRSTPSP
eukprot:CAMPEP_0179325234 /NCGR_PEP_ID=MMETSP0797-20121207/60767_1 /TAXON_ID=47934 /ORGANISM="Dinophysis acuminata, Strain DAEP01" /LENGTH=55 /DNA_ID=CAMNT_0021037373 /DNA_START=55 /DNA_END=222 /DNA_ORIENTATION=+